MRVLGVDFGQKRIGLALSDPTATLARPWQTVKAGASPKESAMLIADLVKQVRDDDSSEAAGIATIVVGVPKRLNGADNDQTQPARDFALTLGARTGLPVEQQDERLSSHEADQMLAVGERDWRRRKAKLDAAAAAVILQDFLDARQRRGATA